MKYSKLCTGNEYITLPNISASTAGIQAIGFIHSSFRGCIELHGDQETPLLRPIVEIDGNDILAEDFESELQNYWIPKFRKTHSDIKVEYTVFAPVDRRGFVCVLNIDNISNKEIELKVGLRGCWKSSFYTTKIKKQMSGIKEARISSWQINCPVIEFRGEIPLFAIAFASEFLMKISFSDGINKINDETNKDGLKVKAGFPLYFEFTQNLVVKPGQRSIIPIYVGIALEEVSAISSAMELKLQGWERLLNSLSTWLARHTLECDDSRMNEIINMNSFYNYFFSKAITIDREEQVIMAARSSSNDSCATYMDRDAMRWSLPAVLQIDWPSAREMMCYSFTTQLRNVGTHSRFIDGIVMEPGLQLDQLCSPLRALQMYVELTDDTSVLFDRRIQAGINTIQQILAAQRHPEVALFETLLLPSGELSEYPYNCFSNVLSWRILLDLGRLYERIRDLDRSDEASGLASQVKEAIMNNFVFKGPFGDMFARSIDLNGNYEFGDNPEGSLQLLTYLGFCEESDPIYLNTVSWIRSKHNPNWKGDYADLKSTTKGTSLPFLTVINDLLTHRKREALAFLKNAELDNGMACEYVDISSGAAMDGYDRASIAGFLAFALRRALNAKTPSVTLVKKKERPSETLYAPPPEISYDIKKARL